MGRLAPQVFTGKGGKIFLDGEIKGFIKEINIKVTGDFEDLEICGTYENISAYTGYDTEGNMTMYKTETGFEQDIMRSFETGEFPDHTIVCTLTNPNTGISSNYSIPHVVFTECTPVDTKKGVLEHSYPFKCGMPRRIQ